MVEGAGPVGAAGINYLTLVVQQWQQTMLRRLGVADPSDVLGVQVTDWPLINVITWVDLGPALVGRRDLVISSGWSTGTFSGRMG